MSITMNADQETVKRWGFQWRLFDQSNIAGPELQRIFNSYFKLFPWDDLPIDAVGIDIGCGTGRWADFVAPRVGELHCVEVAAPALEVARRKLAGHGNCRFHLASLDAMPIPDGSMDFAYAIGVFHYVPEPMAALESCVRKLKPGAPFLLYVYYALDNRPLWYRGIWRWADLLRRMVSSWPLRVKLLFSQVVAVLVYFPLARLSLAIERSGGRVDLIPLSGYRSLSFGTMQNDALSRFGYGLEHRFTKREVMTMMALAGLERVSVSDRSFWTAVGYRKNA